MGLLVVVTILALLSVADGLPMGQRLMRNNTETIVFGGTEHPFPEFNVVVSNRGYAYMMALLVMAMFAAFVYCHVSSIRKTRLLEQYAQQGTLPEWSPLLITNGKNMRPPPPYEQVV